MADFQTFDLFLIELNNKIKEDPDNKRRLIQDAMQGTGCPYLKERLQNSSNELPPVN